MVDRFVHVISSERSQWSNQTCLKHLQHVRFETVRQPLQALEAANVPLQLLCPLVELFSFHARVRVTIQLVVRRLRKPPSPVHCLFTSASNASSTVDTRLGSAPDTTAAVFNCRISISLVG
eukprot:TRINITY_DN20500_c0_g1_i6.p1 TRINITY_DN20500_c0_g1~~TRINITY_DN20500_c0_g1_i6.p1  ORF type:complete len:121 (-),score=5.89 TRINITY_DN20500_c0_g1_i6:445-807(-)